MNGATAATAANGPFNYKGSNVTFAAVIDGLSNTLFVGERHIPNWKYGASPADMSIFNGDFGTPFARAGLTSPLADGPSGNGEFGSYHIGICQFVFGDGAVRALRTSIDGTNLSNLANRKDGQVITTEF